MLLLTDKILKQMVYTLSPVNHRWTLAMGTCHLSLQGLDQVLLHLPIFNTPWREFTIKNEAFYTLENWQIKSNQTSEVELGT